MAEEQKLGTLWFGAEVRLDELKKQIKEGNQDILNALTLSIDDKTAKQMIQNLQNALNSHPVDVKLNVNGKSITDSIGQLEKALSAGSISELGVFENRVNSIRQKIKELQEQMDALPRNKSGKLLLAGDEERLKTMTAQMKELQSQEAVVVANLTGAQKRYSDALEVTRVNAENVARAVQQINQAEQKGGTQQGGVLDTQKFKTLQEAIDKIIGEINRLQQAFTHLGENSSLSNLSTMINGLAVTLSSLSNAIKIQPLDEQVKALLDRCEKAEAKLREVGDAARYLNERAGAKTQQKAANISEIAGINDKATVSLEKYKKLLYDVENALYRLNNISAAGGSKLLNQPIEQLEQMRRMLNELGVKGENGRIVDTLLSESDYAKIRELFNAIKAGYKDVASESDRYTKSKQNGAAATSHLSEEERKLASAIKSSTDSMRGQSQVLSDLKTMATQYLSIWGAQSFVNNIIQTGGLLEQQRMSIGAILGDLSQANHLFGQIQQLALKSPFGVVQLDTMSKQLTAYNFKYSELYDWTKRLADISAATGTEVSRLALALGHVRSEGALSGYTLRQFAMGNVPMLQTLATQLGKTTSEIRKMTREKAITYEDVEQALRTLTDEGGIFFNAQEVMSNALNAKFKNLHDAFDIMFGKMAESGVGDALKGLAETLTVLAKNWETVGATILSVAGAVGVYRAGQLIANKTMVESNALMGRYTAKQLEMQARTGALTKETLLQAVAMKKYTVAEALAAAKTYDLTAAQLKAVATSGRVNAAYTTATISTSKYTMAQLRLMASFKYASWASFTKYIIGMQLALGGLANAARVAGVALKGIFLNPATWWMVAIMAGVEAWMHFSKKADEAKERVKDLIQTANEGFKALEKESENFKIGASLGMDKKQLQEAIGQMEETLKSYSPQAGNILSEAFKIDESTGKSVHSLQERYEMLAKAIQETKESYVELGKIGDILEQSNNDTDGWFDESFRENTEDYIDALKDWNKAEIDFVANNRTNIIEALSKTKEAFSDYNAYIEKATSAFKASEGKEGFSENDLKAQLDAFVKFGEAGNYFAREIHRYGGEAYEQMKNWENASNDVSVAFKRMDGDMETFTTKTKQRLEAAFGATVENWTNSQKLAVQKSIEIFMTGINGYSDMAEKERMEMEEKLLAPFGIKIDIDARDANKQLTDMQLYLNNLVGKDWVVKLKLETVGSFEDLYDQLDKTVKKSGETIKKLGDGISDERKRLASTPMLSPEVLDTLTDKEKEYREAVLNRSKAIQTANQEGFKLSSLEKENQKANRAANKAESAAEKAAKEKTKQEEARLKIEEELAKQRLELQDAIADAEVAAIENNAERERAQREVEFEKQKRQLDRQVEEWKKKSFELAKKEYEANPENKKVSFFDTPVGKAGWQGQSLNDNQLKIYAAEWKKITAEQSRYEREYYEQKVHNMRDYFKQYGTFEEQRYAIEKEYDNKIAKERDAWLKKQLSEQKKKALEAVDIELLRTEIDWSTMFEGIGGALENEMKATLEKIEKYMQSSAFKKLDAKEKSEYVKMRNELYEKTGSGTGTFDFSIYGKIADELKTYQEAVVNHKQALIFHTDAMNKLKAIDLEVEEAKEKLKKAVTEEEQRKARENLKAKLEKQKVQRNVVAGSGQWVQTTETGVVTTQGNVTRSLSAAEKALTNFSDALNQISSGTLRGFADGVVNLVSAIGGSKGNGLSGLGQTAGIIGAILQIIDALGETPAKFFDDLFDKISSVVQAIIEQIPQIAASVIKGAGNIVGSVFTGLANLTTNLATDLFGGGPDWSAYDEALDKWGNILDIWKDTIDYQRELMEKAYGANVIEIQNKTVEQLEKVMQAAKDMYIGWMNSGDGTFSHSNGYNINETANWRYLAQSDPKMLEQLGAKVWKDEYGNWHDEEVGDLRKLAEMDWKQLEAFKNENAQFWETIHGDVRGYLETIIEAGKELEEATKRAQEKLTTTTEENVFEDFLNSLYELADGSEDVFDDIAKNWQKMVNRMVINNLIASKFQEQIKGWYKDLAQLQKERNGYEDENGIYHGPIDDDEYEARLNKLKSDYDGFVTDAESDIEFFTEQGIIKPLDEASSKISDIFSNIENSFKSLISETEPDMEEWGKNVKNSIIENLIEAMVFGEEFKAWMKQLTEDFNKIWEEYEENKDEDKLAAALAGLDSQIDAKGGEIADIIKKLKETLGYSLSEDSPFSGLRDSFLDTLMNMEDDAEAFRKRMEEIMVKDLIDKQVFTKAFTIGDDAYKNLDEYITKWNERYAEAVKNNDTTLIDQLLDELVQVREMTINEAEELRERLKKIADDETFKNLSDSWVSTLMDMSKTAEDWAENIGKIMAEQIIKQMIVPTYIQPLLDELQKVFNDVMDKATTTDEKGNKSYDWKSVIGSDELQAQLDILKEQYPEIQALVKQIMEAFNLDTSNYKYSGFSNLGDSILESLKSSESSLEDWAKSMGQQMAEDMAKAYIDSHYSEQIKNLNEQWQKALQEGNTDLMQSIEEQLSMLYGNMADDPELQRLIDKFRELADNPFKDMASDFASALMDMEQSAEDFANNIAKSLTQEMITKVIKDQYQGEIDALGEQWKQALEQGDSAAIERIRQQLEVLYGQMGDAVKPLLDAISDIGKETDKTFSSMTDSWVSALMDMEGTAEDFAQSVGKTMAQKIITEMIAPVYIQPLLDAMQKRFNQLMAIPGITIAQVLSEMTPFIGQIEDVYRQIQPMIEEIFGTIGIVADSVEEAAEEVEYALSDMKSNFVSALMDMTNSAEDFSKDISKILAQTFIEKFVLGEKFDQQMEYWQQQYESIIGSGMSEDERKRQLKALRDTIVAAKEGYVNEAMAIQELFGLTTEDNQTATMNMADKITYDQADQLLGINLAQELTLEQILAELQGKDVLRVGGSGMTWQSASSAQNDEQGKLINATLTNFAQMTQMSHDNILTQVAMANSHLQMIRDYSKKICDQVELHMESMDDKLSHLRNW